MLVSLGSVIAALLAWLASYSGVTAVAAVPVVDHVVLVSVDGLNPDAIRQLGPAGAPTFHRLMDQGATTLDARTVHEATKTLPNHTSMVTGRPVTDAGGHGVTFNGDNGSTVHANAGTYVASAFDVVHDNGGSTALYSGKDKMGFLDRSWNGTNGAVDRTGADDGRDKIDVYQQAEAGELTDALVSSLAAAPPDFAMLHLRGPDSVGHAQGYMSRAYVDEVAATDQLIGRILDTVESSASLAASTVVVVTSDHGGLGHGHGDETQPVNYTIPFFVWGTGVRAGANLYALNPDRADPGTAQPGYGASPQPIRNADAANLVTDLLGFPAIPGSTINADQSIDI